MSDVSNNKGHQVYTWRFLKYCFIFFEYCLQKPKKNKNSTM